MPTNDFIAFGTGGGANVDSQATYVARANNLGFPGGSVATSSWVNKALRQATSVTAMVGQFIADKSGQNAVDDGNIATLEARFILAIQASITAGGVLSFNGRSGAVALSSADVVSALGGSPIFVGGTPTGDCSGSFPNITINAGAVTNGKLANMPALTVKANLTGAPAPPTDATMALLAAALGIGAMQQGAAGYATIPGVVGGVPATIIIQWGFRSCGDDSLNLVTLPTPFPNSCDWIGGGVFKSSVISGGNGGGFYGNIVSASQINVGMAFAGGTAGDGVYWFAIGH